MDAWVVWLIAAGVLLVFEMMTLTFYLLWLSLGAAVAAIIALITPEGFLLQVLVGCLVALGLTFLQSQLSKSFVLQKDFRILGPN